MRKRWLHALLAFVATAIVVSSCGGDGDSDGADILTPTPVAPTQAPATRTPATSPTVPSTPTAAATPSAVPQVDPCRLRMRIGGGPLFPGPSFQLNEAVAWQLCIGGAAAGSSEKYLFMTEDGGASWSLISMTTFGNPPPEPGVGELPNGNAAEALFFIDRQEGWLGLSSPGQNLYRTEDGGVSWTPVPALPPGLPVLDIQFSDPQHGMLTTPQGTWTTSDGGDTWMPAAS